MYAVNNHYWYQMYIDDLPIWGKKTYFYSFCDFTKTYYKFLLFVPAWCPIIHQSNTIYILGIVGESENKGESLYMWTHKKFEIGYNGNRVREQIKLY